MAKRVRFLTRSLLILLLTVQWSIGVQGVTKNSTDVCGPNALPDACVRTDENPVEDMFNVWQVDIDCSVPDTLRVRIEGQSSAELEEIVDVHIYCTDGSDQVEMPVNCSYASKDVVINNVSESGIQPGWTCYVSGCFFLDYSGDRANVLARTQTDSCTFDSLQAPTTTDLSTTTSTDTLPTTSAEGDVTMPTGVGDLFTTGIDESSTELLDPSLILSIIVPIIGILFLLITIALLTILLLSWMKQQKARKTALLVLDPQNMIFDPDYTPSICIDNEKAAHRVSVISNMNYLHFITAMENADHFQTDVQVGLFDETDSRFGSDLTLSESKQQNSRIGATKDMATCPEEYPGSNTSGYVLSGHSKGLNSPQQMDTNQDEFHSPSDSASELTLSCGSCHSSDYIGNTIQLGNPGLVQDDDSSETNQETMSGDSLSLLMPDNDDTMKGEAGAIGLDRCSHPSSSSAGYVEQFNTLNRPPTRDADNVFESDLELEHKQHDSNQLQSQLPTPSNITHNNHQTAGYVVDFQNAHQLDIQCHANRQEPEITCLSNYLEYPIDVSDSDIQSTHVELDSQQFQSDVPHLQLTNTEGYVLSDHPTATSLAVTQECESQELSVALDCVNLFKEGKKEQSHNHSSQAGGLPSLSVDGDVNGHSLDMPCEPDKCSNQGYINTEDIDMTRFTSRDIIVPSSQFPPSQSGPSFTVCLDFDKGIASHQDQAEDQSGYVCTFGKESKCNIGMQLHPQSLMCLDTSNPTIESNGYVTSELEPPSPISGTTQREQYVSYDFRSMASELRDSYSADSTSTTSAAVHSPDLGLRNIHFQPKSNYYPASDMSSGYLSESSVSCDASVYLGMDKLEQLDLYNYK